MCFRRAWRHTPRSSRPLSGGSERTFVMAISEITELTKCSYGTSPVLVGRGDSASISVQERTIDSADPACGTRYSDTVLTEIKADLQARDPLAVPLLAALAGGSHSLILGGRI